MASFERKFGRKLRKRSQVPLETKAVAADDYAMLAAGKQFLEEQGNVFELADDNVLVVVDVRDSIGALWACIESGELEAAGDDDELGCQIVANFAAGITSHDGKPNPYPFVPFWVPREPGVLDWLCEMGFGVPQDWRPALSHAPQAGNVWTILKRNSAGLLISVDYTEIVSPSAVGVTSDVEASESEK
jgi:hypothetical protein